MTVATPSRDVVEDVRGRGSLGTRCSGAQRGLRFSTKAFVPSSRSGCAVCSWIACQVRSSPSCEADVEALPDRLLDARERGRRVLGDHRGELARARQQLGRGQHLADESELAAPAARRCRSEPPSSAMRSTASSGMRRARPTGSSPAIRPDLHVGVEEGGVSRRRGSGRESAMKWSPPPTTMPFTAVMTGFQQRFWIAVR